MTQEEIISMAKESGMMVFEDGSTNCYYHDLERFAKLVAEKERESIWNILFEYAGRDDLSLDDESLLKDRKSTRLNSSHIPLSRMPSSA